MKSDNYDYKNIFFDGIPISPCNRVFPSAGVRSSVNGNKKSSFTRGLKKIVQFFTPHK
jgi:hypothetical protein